MSRSLFRYSLVIVYTGAMLKRLLMIWLVTCTLGYGAVWAFDGHIDEVAEHQAVAGDTRHAPGGGDGHQSSCDHCCHAMAHIMALWPSQTGMFSADTGTRYTPYQDPLSFLSTAPPERPPQV